MLNYINPSFKLFGTIEIYWYAVCILIGVILAVLAGVREERKSVFQVSTSILEFVSFFLVQL